ncbi:CMGC kinase [Cladorrhinum sp. PSN259]|nr:CMGC kinase [Cladorrhinum sp. PSN259]
MEGAYPDDASDIYIEMDHAPYQSGGFHPLHLGDLLGPDGRCQTIHKLGRGGFGTVWLSQDTRNSTYVALKVMIGDLTRDKILDLNLNNLDRDVPGAQHIAIPSDHFSLQLAADPTPILRKLAHQAAQAMKFLHKNKICHGDFRPSDILVKLTNLDHLSEEELLSLIGKPIQSKLPSEYLPSEICIIDFGESYPIDSQPESLGIPENYLPPEVLLQNEQQIALFYMIYDRDELLAEYVRFFGKMPENWWDKWSARQDWFDEEGRYLTDLEREADGLEVEEWSLEVLLSKPTEVVAPERKVLWTGETEQKTMADLFYMLFRYEPEERISAEAVVEHEWFKM